MEKNKIYFYTVKEKYGFLSNFSPHSIYLESKIWPTVEHWFQAKKFEGINDKYVEKIRKASSPFQAKQLGNTLEIPIRPDWEDIKESIMKQGLIAKFTQHPDLKKKLLDTGDSELIEHTSKDFYWADGGDGSGKNRLGYLLMEVRQELLENKY